MSYKSVVQTRETQIIEDVSTEMFCCDICKTETNVESVMERSKQLSSIKDPTLKGWVTVTDLSQDRNSKIMHVCPTCAEERFPEYSQKAK